MRKGSRAILNGYIKPAFEDHVQIENLTLGVSWDIIIDNHIHRRTIKSSTGKIRADKNITFSNFELVQGFKSFGLSTHLK